MDMIKMRQGHFADKYFANIAAMLEGVRHTGGFTGKHGRDIGRDLQGINIGDIEVEMQVFTRHSGRTIVVGVDQSLEMLRLGTGHTAEDGTWIDTSNQLEIEAIQDGDSVHYHGDPKKVQPIIRVRGRYRDFALLETTILGTLSRGSRICR